MLYAGCSCNAPARLAPCSPQGCFIRWHRWRQPEQGSLWRQERARCPEKPGASGAAASKDIVIEAPQIAENGAVVPIEITSNIPGTKSISVLIEKNPFPLTARFDFMEGALPSSSST